MVMWLCYDLMHQRQKVAEYGGHLRSMLWTRFRRAYVAPCSVDLEEMGGLHAACEKEDRVGFHPSSKFSLSEGTLIRGPL